MGFTEPSFCHNQMKKTRTSISIFMFTSPLQVTEPQSHRKKPHSMADQNLGIIAILIESLKIPLKNIKFLAFASFASLPLFTFLVFFETLLQRSLLDASEIMSRVHDHRMAIDCSQRLIHLTILYLLPLQLFELGTAIATIDIASEIYIESKPMTLMEMLHKPFKQEALKRAFYTSICVLSLSTCAFLGLVWLIVSFFYFYHYYNYRVFVFCFGVALCVMLVKYLERSVVWSMSIVVSLLEEGSGFRAMAISGYVCRGRGGRGMVLAIVFFVYGIGLRMMCLFLGCKERGFRVLGLAGLLCVGGLWKWLVCLVWYFDCKSRVLEKKIGV